MGCRLYKSIEDIPLERDLYYCRLSAITSSRLRDNNPNLTDLSDPYRPSKIGEMFSELYDNEWTNAYDELGESKLEVEKIQQLNAIVMVYVSFIHIFY